MAIIWQEAKASDRQIFEAISTLFCENPRLLEFLFDPRIPRIRERAGILREDLWSFEEDEQLLIRAALDLWSGSGHLQLWEMVETWGPETWVSFLVAISQRFALKEELMRHLSKL